MNFRNSILNNWRGRLILAVTIVVFCLSIPAYCQPGTAAFMLQQTPANSGTITPGIGVHSIDLDTEITLTATPGPGYQFVYWLGDVSDPTSSTTTAYSDSPKIIIAVFERVGYESILTLYGQQEEEGGEMGMGTSGGGGGGGGLIAKAPDYSNRGYTGGGRKRPHKFVWPTRPTAPEMPKLPVPDAEDDTEEEYLIPIPDTIATVPEPATMALLVFGSLFALRRNARKV